MDPTSARLVAELKKEQSQTLTAAAVFALVWGIAGFAAFITSLICFGRSGTMGQQVAGLVIAVLFGPFYWIYFASVKSYCAPFGMLKGGANKRK